MNRIVLVATGIAFVVFVALAVLLFSGREDEPGEAPDPRAGERATVPEAEPSPSVVDRPSELDERAQRPMPSRAGTPEPRPADESEREALPALAESDDLVRDQLEAFGWPGSWGASPRLIPRLAVVIENAGRGEIFRRPVQFLRLDRAFAVVERDGRIYADTSNEARFDPLLERLEAVDPAILARTFERFEPLIDEAMAELGGDMNARESLQWAIKRVLEADLPAGPHELVRPKVLYEYADENLESASDLDKLLLRMGERNRARLRAVLRGVDRAL